MQFIIPISLHQDYKLITYWDSYKLYTKSPNKSCHIKKNMKKKKILKQKNVAALILSLCPCILQSSQITWPFTSIVTRLLDYSVQWGRLLIYVLYFLSMLSDAVFAPSNLLIWLHITLIPWSTDCTDVSGHHQFGWTFFCVYCSSDFTAIRRSNKYLLCKKYVCISQLLRWLWGRIQAYINECVQKA